jgi:hypothetical protein
MTVSSAEEARPLISNQDDSTVVQGTRWSYQKQIAVHLILASILFESAAFNSLDSKLADSLEHNTTLNWTSPHGSIAEHIFQGR